MHVYDKHTDSCCFRVDVIAETARAASGQSSSAESSPRGGDGLPHRTGALEIGTHADRLAVRLVFWHRFSVNFIH